jgi:hypothetical protein
MCLIPIVKPLICITYKNYKVCDYLISNWLFTIFRSLFNVLFSILALDVIDEKTIEKVDSISGLLQLLQKNKLFSQSDVIFIQGLFKQIECKDLYNKCIEYARKQGALCFYEKPPGAFLHKFWYSLWKFNFFLLMRDNLVKVYEIKFVFVFNIFTAFIYPLQES